MSQSAHKKHGLGREVLDLQQQQHNEPIQRHSKIIATRLITEISSPRTSKYHTLRATGKSDTNLKMFMTALRISSGILSDLMHPYAG